jgi:hypothetical protein
MKLKFYKAADVASKAKATIHKTGKLGFSSETIGYLGIEEGKYIKFAQNEEDENDVNLYAVLSDVQDEDCFRIHKSGNYYYVNTKGLFDSIGIEYFKKTIIYDIVKSEYEGAQIIKMNRREICKTRKGGEDK